MAKKTEKVDLRLPKAVVEGLAHIAKMSGMSMDAVIAVGIAQQLRQEIDREDNKAPEPFYTMGQNFIALGMAMRDQRTSITDLAGCAHDCGLRLKFQIGAEPEV